MCLLRLVFVREGLCETHVSGDGAGLSKDDGEVEEGRGEEQAGGADQRVGAGGPRPQLPADYHAAGHAQHPRHHGDGAEDQTVGGGTVRVRGCPPDHNQQVFTYLKK